MLIEIVARTTVAGRERRAAKQSAGSGTLTKPDPPANQQCRQPTSAESTPAVTYCTSEQMDVWRQAYSELKRQMRSDVCSRTAKSEWRC